MVGALTIRGAIPYYETYVSIELKYTLSAI